MKHVGDITKLCGYSVPIPDVVTGGSPCQDLSIAGNRAGLSGERSGMFMEQMRVIKELRTADAQRTNEPVRPRYMVWENVPGALSSRKGEDFRIVLEETAKIADPDAIIPPPPKGKWRNTGIIMGDGWSIAWRILDAQFWGVPQRRRRIALVADFGGQSAPEILFVRKGMYGDFESGGASRQGTSGTTSRGVAIPINTQIATRHMQLGEGTGLGIGENGDPAYTLQEAHSHAVLTPQALKIRSGCDDGGKGALMQDDLSATLSCGNDQTVFVPTSDLILNDQGGQMIGVSNGISPTLRAEMHGNIPCVLSEGCLTPWESQRRRIHSTEAPSPTLDGSDGGGGAKTGLFCLPVTERSNALGVHQNADGELRTGVVANTLLTNGNASGRNAPLIFESHQHGNYKCGVGALRASGGDLGGGSENICVMSHGQANAEITENIAPTLNCNHEKPIVMGVDCRNGTETPELCATLQAHEGGGTSLNTTHPIRIKFHVRRLTPLECERLQGYPDGWTAIPDYIDDAGKKRTASDTARYKVLGNSIALPPWKWILKRISAQYERDATLGSLFDGIGGFPYIWEQINGKGSALWASEIEPFCIAVTERRFNQI